jgi:N-acetyl-gamma-glutamyl-phosphate reductase
MKIASGIAPIAKMLEAGVRVVDLAADFRLREPELWERWYGMPHACPELLVEAVYGLPELNRERIRQARLVANPGCYPTAAALGFLPLVENGLVDSGTLVADCKSGVSGAGRGAKVDTLMGEVGESFKAYAADGHRHLPEIKQTLSGVLGQPVGLTFVPHLVPMIRGIHATLYGRLVVEQGELQRLYEARYAAEPFVDVLPGGSHPETRSVRGVNHCRIALHRPQAGDTVVVLSVIDNLTKGAAGQAVQNMNLMFGFDERCGLEQVALLP